MQQHEQQVEIPFLEALIICAIAVSISIQITTSYGGYSVFWFLPICFVLEYGYLLGMKFLTSYFTD